jgi:hypothetical protein
MAATSQSAIAVIGIDIGKNSFHVVGLDGRGAIVLRQKWSRGQVETRFANMSPCLIGMEACVGAHHLSRKLKALGHDARLMPARYVRPYSKGQKNDFHDAEADSWSRRPPISSTKPTRSSFMLSIATRDLFWTTKFKRQRLSALSTLLSSTSDLAFPSSYRGRFGGMRTSADVTFRPPFFCAHTTCIAYNGNGRCLIIQLRLRGSLLPFANPLASVSRGPHYKASYAYLTINRRIEALIVSLHLNGLHPVPKTPS